MGFGDESANALPVFPAVRAFKEAVPVGDIYDFAVGTGRYADGCSVTDPDIGDFLCDKARANAEHESCDCDEVIAHGDLLTGEWVIKFITGWF